MTFGLTLIIPLQFAVLVGRRPRRSSCTSPQQSNQRARARRAPRRRRPHARDRSAADRPAAARCSCSSPTAACSSRARRSFERQLPEVSRRVERYGRDRATARHRRDRPRRSSRCCAATRHRAARRRTRRSRWSPARSGSSRSLEAGGLPPTSARTTSTAAPSGSARALRRAYADARDGGSGPEAPLSAASRAGKLEPARLKF